MNKLRIFAGVFFSVIFILLLITILLHPFSPAQRQKKDNMHSHVPQPRYLYGFNLDSFRVDSGLIGKNMSFSDLMRKYNYSPIQISALEDSSKNIFPLNKIKHGKRYFIFIPKDSQNYPQYFVYEEDPINYLVLYLQKPLIIKLVQKDVDTVICSLGGIITKSLWEDMISAGALPALINGLSEVYEWDIDFFRIQKNDKFKIIYEEIQIEHKTIGIGKILAAWFEHEGNDYYAIRYKQNSREDFFDAKGNNLRKMFLKAPLKFSRISSGFTNSRFHPILHRYRPHYGIDYAARSGTPVHAIGDGTVIYSGYQGGGGKTVKIRHNSVYTSAYLHLSRFGKGIRKGVRVHQGDVIGYVGSTGLSTGAHLDFRIWKNGRPINPLTLKTPPVESVSKENMADFNKIRDKKIKELDNIKIPSID